MPLPPGFELESSAAPSVKLPPGFELETAAPQVSEIPAARSPGFMTQLGRGAASLADVTVGGVIPAIAQQVVYPFARVGRSPEEAQAITQGIVGAVDQPFGKAFGVTNTPEYQGEATRQLLGFVGENFQKGTKWISDATGLSVPDTENLMGLAAIAAPEVVRTAGPTVKKAATGAVQQAKVGAKLPFEKRIAAKAERASLEDYARGPQIEAATEAQRLKIALNPTDIQPGAGTRLMTAVAGEKGQQLIAKRNIENVRRVALNEMDLPPTTQLNSPEAFNQARAKVAKPYNEIVKLPAMAADDATRAALESLRPDESLIGSDRYAAAVNHIIDDAVTKAGAGLTGDQLLKNIQTLRTRARKVYNNKNADLAALDVADTNLAVANTLESMIESNIADPKLLSRFRDARQKMARSYAYEGATDMNTGLVDVKKLARITSKDNALTGDIASLGKIAGNFPDAFTSKVSTVPGTISHIGRTGVAGTLGGLSGYMLTGDYAGAAVGSVLGAVGGELGQSFASRYIASPGYQSGLTVRDMRIPMNQLANVVAQQAIPQNRAIVPYQAPVEVLPQGEGPYRPNFVFSQQKAPGKVTPVTPPSNRLLGAPSAESTIQSLRAEDARRAALSRTMGREAEMRQAATEAATRRPASGEVILELDPVTGKFREVSQGVKGATPETFSNFGSALETASAKVTSGRKFAMTAAEKVAWDKTKVDLAEVAPGFKSLSDKAVSEKMLDRQWVQQTATKAREKAAAFEQIAARAADERARQAAIVSRERMMDLAEQMEESLGTPRPNVSRKQQGPKTREFRRNLLVTGSEQSVNNALTR